MVPVDDIVGASSRLFKSCGEHTDVLILSKAFQKECREDNKRSCIYHVIRQWLSMIFRKITFLSEVVMNISLKSLFNF
jgi:hypothetical protein